MLERLSHIDPLSIQDNTTRSDIVLMLNLIESQVEQISELKEANQKLKDEIARLKGEQGKPNIRPQSSKDYSSAKNIPKPHKDPPIKNKLTFDNKVHCPLDKTDLPSDLVYKGTYTAVSQDIIFKHNNTEYIIEIWHSPSQGKTYRAKLPESYTGYFGNTLKAFCIVMNYGVGVTRKKLLEFLSGMDIHISTGSLQNILTHNAGTWLKEKTDLLKAGLQGPFLQTDSTSARVCGKNWWTHVFVSELFTVFSTMPTKSRRDILCALQGDPKDGLKLKLNTEARAYLAHYRISPKYITVIENIFKSGESVSLNEFRQAIVEKIPELVKKKTTFKWITEALAFGYYFYQTDFPATEILITDDAKEYSLLAPNHALCWIHDARYYNKLVPTIKYHLQILDDFKKRYWAFYGKLKKYKKCPDEKSRNGLYDEFDRIFIPNTDYFDLNKTIKRTSSNKEQLLTVLDFDFIPLHNNASELAARAQVRKRDISLHTMTAMGTKLQDAFLSIIQTCQKLKINPFQYIIARLNNQESDYLSDMLLSKINNAK